MNFKTCTRAEWDAYAAERPGHGFDPEMPWHVANWRERLGIMLFHAFMWGVIFPAMFIGAMWLLASIGDGIGRYNAEHDSCLKHATNGYEIRQCR